MHLTNKKTGCKNCASKTNRCCGCASGRGACANCQGAKKKAPPPVTPQ